MGQIPKNTKNTARPYKQEVFETYAAWRAIPAYIRLKMAPEGVNKLEEDGVSFGDLLDIKTQSQFADRYGIENSTLSNWNKLIQKQGVMNEIRAWSQNLLKNLIWKLYTHCMKTGDPKCIELYLRFVADWTPPRRINSATKSSFVSAEISISTKN